MALTLSTAARNAACDGVVDLVDGGPAAGKLQIFTSGATLLAEITLADPAFGSAASGVATLLSTPLTDSSADATGTADNAALVDSTDADVITGMTVTATGGGGDIELTSLSITATEPVEISSGTITMPAS